LTSDMIAQSALLACGSLCRSKGPNRNMMQGRCTRNPSVIFYYSVAMLRISRSKTRDVEVMFDFNNLGFIATK
jgi:hypothetical protein